MTDSLQIYCDGGARGNPGPAASAFVVLDIHRKKIYEQGRFLGIATNNQAEYNAVLDALSWLSGSIYNCYRVYFYLDSLLVASQLSGLYKIKDTNLREIYNQIQNTIQVSHLRIVKYSHIPRHENFLADFVVNRTLDAS